MEYREIWKKYNVSTILILPVLTSIIENIKTKTNNEYSIHSLFVYCGLINCYLYRKTETSGQFLYLVFDKQKLTNTELFINNPYATLLDILINSKYFSNIITKNDNIIIQMKIDPLYLNDVLLISQSLYSKVSDLYKELLILKGNKVKINDSTMNYLVLKNIPAKIVYKNEKLEKVLQEICNHHEKIKGELFVEFEKYRETLMI